MKKQSASAARSGVKVSTTSLEVSEADDDLQRLLDEVAAQAGEPRFTDAEGNQWYCSREWADKEQEADADYHAGRMGPERGDPERLFQAEQSSKTHKKSRK